MSVKGFQLHITVDLEFEQIHDFLEESGGDVKTVEELREMWNQGELESFLEDNMELEDMVKASGEGAGRYPFQVGSGYYS